MRSLFLALALAQSPGGPSPAPDPDAPFRLAVESWVARHRRPGVSFVHVLGARATGAIEAMAADRYRVRELGASVLVSLPEPERLRALAWGAAHPDREVRARCEVMAAAMLAAVPPVRCRHCGEPPNKRPGICPIWRLPGERRCSECARSWSCRVCAGP
jgi:hypothetical protein